MTIDNAWMIFRMIVGALLVTMFIYLAVTGGKLDTDLIARLLMLLIGILETGSSALTFRASRRAKT